MKSFIRHVEAKTLPRRLEEMHCSYRARYAWLTIQMKVTLPKDEYIRFLDWHNKWCTAILQAQYMALRAHNERMIRGISYEQ
jgi:hypothetical protein